MSRVSIIDTNKYQLEVSAAADMFIIPNDLISLGELYSKSNMVKINKFAEDNGLYMTPSDKICEVWLTSHDLHSDNISDDGIKIDFNEDDIKIFDKFVYERDKLIKCDCGFTSFMNFMPVSLIKYMKENDVKEFRYLISIPSKEYNKELDIKLNLKITAKQLAYRYREFGKFEDVIKRLID